MNEHDSERMKGMLESLGYAEVPERDEADLILFNTCSIREKADERFVVAPARGASAQAARSGARDRRRRLLGAVDQGPRLRAVPVRRRRLRPRPGAQAGRVPDQRLAHRPGLLRVRGLHRPPARQAGARRPRVGADQRRLQHEVLVLHRADDARPRGLAPVRGARGRGRAAGRRGRARGHAARPERQLLRHAPAAAAAQVLRAAARGRRDRRASTASATRARTRRT